METFLCIDVDPANKLITALDRVVEIHKCLIRNAQDIVGMKWTLQGIME